MDMAGIQTHSIFYDFPSYLQVMMIRSKIKALSCPQHFLHYKSIGGKIEAQEHGKIKRIVQFGPKLVQDDMNL